MSEPAIDILKSKDIVQTNVTFLALRNDATISDPYYNYYNNEDMVLKRSAFANYTALFYAIQQEMSAGNQKQQFFRIALQSDYQRSIFLTTERMRTLDLSQTVNLVSVRYTKQQSMQILSRLPYEEQKIAEELQRLKRLVYQPLRKLPKYIQKASALLTNQPPTLLDAYARVKRLSHADDAVCWKTAQYLHAGLIDVHDVLAMEEQGMEHCIRVDRDATQQVGREAKLVILDVPEFLVPAVQRLISQNLRKQLEAQIDAVRKE